MKTQNIIILIISISVVIIAVVISIWLFLSTSLVGSLKLVGDDGIIPTETFLDNVLPQDRKLTSNELLLRYYMGQQEEQMITAGAVIRAIKKIDSLDRELTLWKAYSQNIMDVINRVKEPLKADTILADGRTMNDVKSVNIMLDSILRERTLEPLSQMNTITKQSRRLSIPLMGNVIKNFSYDSERYAILIEPKDVKNSAVSSIDSGTILSCIWTPSEGYVMYIQHSGNLISIYKGFKKPIKDVGDRVSAREVIAYMYVEKDGSIIDDSSDNNTTDIINDTLLSFELWEGGNPIDPERYIVFK